MAILSDPHGNIQALDVVLHDIEKVGTDVVVCLGDFVGYGPNPNEVIDALKDRAAVSLAGNHDLSVLGAELAPVSQMNAVAAAAITWTSENIGSESRVFLESIQSTEWFESFLLVHASPYDPVRHYVSNAAAAFDAFNAMDFHVAIVGHTHIPAIYALEGDSVAGGPIVAKGGADKIHLPNSRVILNPGGVGQPRDGDPRASWAILDNHERTFEVRRVDYEVSKTQAAIMKCGLPAFLAERLSVGI